MRTEKNMYREDFINALQEEIVEVVSYHLTPVAIRFGYTELPLESNIRWRPMVLLIGNYSSGKSSLINELLGTKIQNTGQAPTDDSFTVITFDGDTPSEDGIRVTEERDGKALINDPEYPFISLRKHGQRFASHFKLKKVNSPFLKDLAIIDTPGMLDSITERDRGYDYQEVIGDLAQKAGLVLVLFDAHKAGTVREAYHSIRETLATHTFEDRIIFVLNRIDECTSFDDLLRVYGTLCWNLSQITGRKDIPMIHLTYSPNEMGRASKSSNVTENYLPLLENQREELKKAVLQTPRRRLDHLATFVEVHGERLIEYMEGLIRYRNKFRNLRVQKLVTGILVSLLGGSLTAFALMVSGLAGLGLPILAGLGGLGAGVVLLGWMTLVQSKLETKFHAHILENIDELSASSDQTQKDSWEAVKPMVHRHLSKNEGGYSLSELKRDLVGVRQVHEEASQQIRAAISDLSHLPDMEDETVERPLLAINRPKIETLVFDENYYKSFRYLM